MVIAVSEEEDAIIRDYCAQNNLAFSSWARELVFQAMGIRMPRRY